MMNLNSNYLLAIEAAIEAGIAIKSIYESKKYDIEIKEDDSPVTKADKTSSAIIASYLSRTQFPVIDEEHCCPGYSVRKTWKNLWLVDPMDGTKEFISGNGEFTVNIALINEGRSLFGVIYAPISGILYWGGKETGSFKAENIFIRIEITEMVTSAEKLKPEINTSKHIRIAASRSHLDNNTKDFIDKIKKTFGDFEYISKGSSLKLCMIAEGKTDIYPRFSRTMEWDTAAGHAIVAGTDGTLLTVDSLTEVEYNKEDLSNPAFFALSGPQLKKNYKYF